MSNNGLPRYENGKRYTLQRTEKNSHGVNQGLTRSELVQLAKGVEAANPSLAHKVMIVAGDE